MLAEIGQRDGVLDLDSDRVEREAPEVTADIGVESAACGFGSPSTMCKASAWASAPGSARCTHKWRKPRGA